MNLKKHFFTNKIKKCHLYNESKSNISILNKQMIIPKQFYKDPWFFNKANIDFQLSNMSMTQYNKKRSDSTQNISSANTSIRIKKIFEKNDLNNKKKEDLLLYRRIFKNKSLWKKKPVRINNLLNLRYADNELIYENKAKRENEKLISQGKSPKKLTVSKYLNEHLNEIESKIKFVKCIEDITYPEIVVAKLKSFENIENKEKKERIKRLFHLNPFEERIFKIKKREKEKRLYLSESIKIFNNI